METAIIRRFLDFFQDYIILCQSDKWPSNEISAEELRSAFVTSEHIEKCIDKLHQKSLFTEFLNVLSEEQNASGPFLKHCFANPPKFVLKKIIQSNIVISKLDIAFKIFLDVFSEDKLQDCLSHLMLEKASKETLLLNLQIEISKENILVFKSKLFMSELNYSDNMDKFIMEMLDNCNQGTMDMLTKCLLCKDTVYSNVVNCCVNALLQTMHSKDVSKKQFWHNLFHVKDEDFTQMCLYHSDLFQTITKALLDCAKLIKENISADFFYIDLTYAEFSSVVQKITKNNNLKLEFIDILYTSHSDLSFWNHFIEL